ncbi:MAG: tRNA (guanosine(37)-N1)-methyltransferase TrmD [Candidatus Omnitrophica bacterium]|nr:tRNA (guanosine(37)-N1)-methyltransferase TrmD [Candidatus Omnitrophota bacterium]
MSENKRKTNPRLSIDVLTLFPGMFKGPLEESILKIAEKKGLVRIRIHDIRAYTTDRHKKADDKPFGGGPGMVMKAEPIFRAIEDICDGPSRKIYLTPDGKPFTQSVAKRLSEEPRILLLCGHYEGVDQRVREHLMDEEISIGGFVMTGGEIPALCVIDALVRLVPGVLGNVASLDHESFNDGLLDYPHYTRPRAFRGHAVPEVLISGNHEEVEKWRRKQALQRTKNRRPDLLS